MTTLALITLLCLGTALTVTAKPPNILFIVADDLGWNDVGFRNPKVISPNIDALAARGMILNQSYVQPVCSPSRHAFLSGTYPFKAGLQNAVIGTQSPVCSPLKDTFLPERLKEVGYSTHMIGKWHLGFCNWNCTPTYRGFDTFYGYYTGAEDYYTKQIGGFYDFRDNEKPISDVQDYSVFDYTARAERIVQKHNDNNPFFLYLSFQSAHVPLQVPEKYENMYPDVTDKDRRTFLGMVTAMDEGIGKIMNALSDNGLINETLIIFTSDNGGMPEGGVRGGAGNNFPLRGAKTTVFEGGTRASAFILGPGIQKPGSVYDGMIHAVDWHSTLVAVAGGKLDPSLDSMNHWEELQTATPTKRTEFVYNLDDSDAPVTGAAAIRMGDFKLIQGFPGAMPDWYPPPEGNFNQTVIRSWGQESPALRGQYEGEGLYNLRDDPNEHTDLSAKFPEVVEKLKARLGDYRKHYVPPIPHTVDPKSDPTNFGGFWSPGWC